MKVFLEISIQARSDERELLIVPLMEMGITSFQETEDRLLGYLEASSWTQEKQQGLTRLLEHVFGSHLPRVVYRTIPEENWNRKWEESIRPIEAGERFLIAPTWCRLSPAEEAARLVLRIDPKMSFGTGHHESTRLVLRLLERHLTPGSLMVDVGTGTGVLAIAGVRLGASAALGLEIDEWALQNARENVSINGLEHLIRISDEDVSSLPAASADVVAANITLTTILEMLGSFHRVIKTGGILLLAGLLSADRPQVERALADCGFRTLELLSENEWIGLAARKLK